MRNSLICQLLGVAIVLLLSPRVRAGDSLSNEFKVAKPNLLRLMQATHSEKRAEGLKLFAKYPTAEAVSALLSLGKSSPYPDVRRGSWDVLFGFRQELPVAKTLSTIIAADLKRNVVEPDTVAAAAVLLCSEQEEINRLATQMLASCEKFPVGILLVLSTIDFLAEQKKEPSVLSALRLIENSPLYMHSGLRRAMVQAYTQLKQPEAVSWLIQALPTAKGEARSDLLRSLQHLSGLQAADKPDWDTWWKEKQATFEFPVKEMPRQTEATAGEYSYYGLPVYGSKLMFILDTSGSMAGARMIAAKDALAAAIRELPKDVQYNIIEFNSEVQPWQKEMVFVAPETQRAAFQFIQRCQPRAQTASYDALETALQYDVDAIYFLTDGAPNGGKINRPADIVREISRINRVRRATIHTIGIQTGERNDFMEELASKNFGVYRSVR